MKLSIEYINSLTQSELYDFIWKSSDEEFEEIQKFLFGKEAEAELYGSPKTKRILGKDSNAKIQKKRIKDA